jgi:hypothetical protein
MHVLAFFIYLFFFFNLRHSLAIDLPILVEESGIKPQRQLNSHYGSTLLKEGYLSRVQHVDDIAQKLPGLTSAGGTSRSRFFQIRGIGERSSYEGMPNESVTVLIDDIDYTGLGGVLDTFGLGTLEVYKGPQNTVIGPSSLAGTIRGVTTTLEEKKETVEFSAESFSGRSVGILKGFKVGPYKVVTSTLARKNDGYFRNTFLGREDTNFKEEVFHRSKIKGENLEINLHYFELNSGYDVFNLNNSKETRSEDPGRDDQRTLGASLIYDLSFNNIKFKSILSGHRTNSFYSYDEDWENSSSYDYRIGFTRFLNNLNFEERVTWGGDRLFHTTGLFFKNNHLSSRELGFNAEAPRKDLNATLKRRRLALFHESELLFDFGVSAFGGMRVSYLDSEYIDSNSIEENPVEKLWGGHVGIKGETPNTFWSLRLSKGFKAGGINIGTNITSDRRSFDRESLYSLDFVLDQSFGEFKNRANLFVTYRTDVQVKTSFQDNPSDPSSFTFYTDNATSGYSYGVEGQLDFRSLSHKLYQGSLKYNLMDTRYGSYTYGSRNLKGREFAYAPNYKVSIEHQFNLPLKSVLRIENVLVDRFYFGNSHDEMAPQALLTNLSMETTWNGFSFNPYVRNLFNERTETRGFFFGNRPPNFNNERFVQVNPPRIMGMRVSKKW